MKRENTISFASVIASVFIAILIISASVTFTLFDRGAYDRVQEKLDLSETTGIGQDEILANYNALVDYNSVFFAGELAFPTFLMSDAGRIHFEEVKAIFSVFQIAFIVSAFFAAILSVCLLRSRQYRFLTHGGILSLLIPAIIVCVMAVVGWDQFFIIFHQIFFDNEFWVFDARTDPIIRILPDSFFLYCLIRIIIGISVSAATLMVFSQKLKLYIFV